MAMEMHVGMEKLLANGFRRQVVPENYVLPPEKRPGNQTVSSKPLPVIDLGGAELHGANHEELVKQIMDAGKEFGFCQIVNHGVPEQVMGDMMSAAEEFFEMPVENRAAYYSEDPWKFPRLHTSTGQNIENIRYWRDCLKLEAYPVDKYMHSWPDKPSKFRESLARYAVEVRRVSMVLLRLIAQGLGLKEDYFDGDGIVDRNVMNINYYPPCPDPSLTLGVQGHCDPNHITLLLQGNVSGLQVMHKGQWIAVDPLPNSFVVNFGCTLEILTNGALKSIEHRAVTNSAIARTSIAAFTAPPMDSLIAPSELLVDEQNPPLYRSFLYGEFLGAYLSKIANREEDSSHTMEAYQLQVPQGQDNKFKCAK